MFRGYIKLDHWIFCVAWKRLSVIGDMGCGTVGGLDGGGRGGQGN